jgi:hypothetical protein
LAPTPAEWCDNLLSLYEERLRIAADLALPAASIAGANSCRPDTAAGIGGFR